VPQPFREVKFEGYFEPRTEQGDYGNALPPSGREAADHEGQHIGTKGIDDQNHPVNLPDLAV